MVRQAAKMVRNGELGEIKAVHVEHASGWASKLQEDEKRNEPSWRMNPTRLGDASLLLDLGTHAHHLARFVTGLDVTQVVGELSTIVPGRAIRDNGHALLRFENEARGTNVDLNGCSWERTRDSNSGIWRQRKFRMVP